MNNKINGYVTFADILGWKGIWRSKDDPIEDLLNIKKATEEAINAVENQYEKFMILNYNPEWKLNEDLVRLVYNDCSKHDLLKKIQEIFKLEKEQLKEISGNIKSLNLKLDLISDTFVLTSNSENYKEELIIHCAVNKFLILECLKKGLLIRGATSYGEYYKKDMVYVGPAIDDAASWHEMGEEIGIFLTPLCKINLPDKYYSELSFRKIFNYKDDTKILQKLEPKLKCNTFETYFINWSDGKKNFESIIRNYKVILPGIQMKIENSLKRLKTFYK